MGLFDNVQKTSNSLIQTPEALEYEYLPRELPFRENEQKYLADCIKPLFQKRSGRNLLIHGAPGIGKTAATRFVLRDLEEQSDEVEPIYINCWKHNTTYKVLLEICNIIGYKFTQNKKTFDLYDVVARILNKKAAVFVFDEIDKADDLDFLYFVLEDIYNKSIFLITNYKSFLVNLDERIKSRLVPELFEFRKYNLKEILGILKLRKDWAFYANAWEQDAFDLVSQKTFSLMDIRSGLYLLKESALNTEEKSGNKITVKNVNSAIKKLDDFTIKNSEELETEARRIYEIVREHSGKKIGDLFAIYQKKGGVSSYKTFQRKIAKLEEGKFIHTTKQTGAGGNTTIVEKKLSDF